MANGLAKLRASPEERFWAKVKKGAGCWVWTGAVTTTGYGVFQKGRRGENLHKAHRFSYEIHHGEIPSGSLILHSCDNKLCVNPSHLSPGDHSQNIKEAWSRSLRKPSEWNKNGFANLKRKMHAATL
jgi:hypothetical protein